MTAWRFKTFQNALTHEVTLHAEPMVPELQEKVSQLAEELSRKIHEQELKLALKIVSNKALRDLSDAVTAEIAERDAWCKEQHK